MSILQYLQLQPVDDDTRGTDTSDLDKFKQDEKFDLDDGIDEQEFHENFQKLVDAFENDPDKIDFSSK